MSPMALSSPRGLDSGSDHAWSGPCDLVPLGSAPRGRKPVTVCLLGGAPMGGHCPVFSSTALQDLGLRPQRHPSPSTMFSGTTPSARNPVTVRSRRFSFWVVL